MWPHKHKVKMIGILLLEYWIWYSISPQIFFLCVLFNLKQTLIRVCSYFAPHVKIKRNFYQNLVVLLNEKFPNIKANASKNNLGFWALFITRCFISILAYVLYFHRKFYNTFSHLLYQNQRNVSFWEMLYLNILY